MNDIQSVMRRPTLEGVARYRQIVSAMLARGLDLQGPDLVVTHGGDLRLGSYRGIVTLDESKFSTFDLLREIRRLTEWVYAEPLRQLLTFEQMRAELVDEVPWTTSVPQSVRQNLLARWPRTPSELVSIGQDTPETFQVFFYESFEGDAWVWRRQILSAAPGTSPAIREHHNGHGKVEKLGRKQLHGKRSPRR